VGVKSNFVALDSRKLAGAQEREARDEEENLQWTTSGIEK